MCAEIVPLFGLTFATAIWNAGFVAKDRHVFLLVTLEKNDHLEGHQYLDHFILADRFQWQSKNRTAQASKHGQILRLHREKGIAVHLFVRRAKKTNGRLAPGYYCGYLAFENWKGEKPITSEWQLPAPVQDRFRSLCFINLVEAP